MSAAPYVLRVNGQDHEVIDAYPGESLLWVLRERLGLPGSKNLGESNAVRRLSQKVHASGGICAALCAAPALTLSPFGLLEGRVATCHPAFMDTLGGGATPSEERVVVDGNIVTSRGAGTALDFSLKLAELLVDEKTASALREAMVAGP